jgi:hypothetical protein
MELEYEIENFLGTEEEKLLNYCPSCGNLIFGNYCERCKKTAPTEKYFDPDWEKYATEVESEGEKFDKELSDPSKWVEVPDN